MNIRQSRFKTLKGKLWMNKYTQYGIEVGNGQGLVHLLKTNGRFLALPFNRSGGNVAFNYVNNFGKWRDNYDRYIRCHKKPLTDFEFVPYYNFNYNSKNLENLICTSCIDEIKFWELPNDVILSDKGIDKEILRIEAKENVKRVGFHNLINSLFYYISEKKVIFFDLQKPENICYSIDKIQSIESISWNYCGNQFVTGTKDKKIKLFDMRSDSIVAEYPGHASSKPSYVTYLDNNNNNNIKNFGFNFIFSVGESAGNREILVFDNRKTKEFLNKIEIDSGTSSLFPYLDFDLKLVFLGGKGDLVVKYYEFDLNQPYCHYCNEYFDNSGIKSLYPFPKNYLDVNNNEISKFLKLTNDNRIEILSFDLLRKDKNFQEDIFPDTWNKESIYKNFDEWKNSKKEILPDLISLKPESKISIFDIPTEEGGKIRQLSEIDFLRNDVKIKYFNEEEFKKEIEMINNNEKENKKEEIINEKELQRRNEEIEKEDDEKIENDILIEEEIEKEKIEEIEKEEEILIYEEFNKKLKELEEEIIFYKKEDLKTILIRIGLIILVVIFGFLFSGKKLGNILISYFVIIFIEKFYFFFKRRREISNFISLKFKEQEEEKRLQEIEEKKEKEEDKKEEKEEEKVFKKKKKIDKIITKIIKQEINLRKRIVQVKKNFTPFPEIVEIKQKIPIEEKKSFPEDSSLENNLEVQKSTEIILKSPRFIQTQKKNLFPELDHEKQNYLPKQRETNQRIESANKDILNLINLKKNIDEKTSNSIEIDHIKVKQGKQPMLFMIRGRLNSRVIEIPCNFKSMHNNFSYVMDLGNKLFQWNGLKSNRIIRSRALDFATNIKFKERGGDAQIIVLNEKKIPENSLFFRLQTHFWKRLGFKDNSTKDENEEIIAKQSIIDLEKDEDWEKAIDNSLKIYRIMDEDENKEIKLIEIDLFKKNLPTNKILDSNFCYLLTFGFEKEEVLVWNGKKSINSSRQFVFNVGKRISDYFSRTNSKKWSSFQRVIENGETNSWKIKFSDYPSELMIKLTPAGMKKEKKEKIKQKKIDSSLLYNLRLLKKENNSEIKKPINEEIKIWIIKEFNTQEYPSNFYGNFFSKDAFIILYSYQMTEGSKKITKILFWQGAHCSKKNKGASALKTIEVAKELSETNTQQIRIVQTREPIGFFELFNNKYIVHKGSFEDSFFKNNKIEGSSNKIEKEKKCFMYVLKIFVCDNENDTKKSSSLIECDSLDLRLLNSRRIFFFVDKLNKKIMKWIGKFCSEIENELSENYFKILRVLFEIEENDEENNKINFFEIKEDEDNERFLDFFKNLKINFDIENIKYSNFFDFFDKNTKPKLFQFDDASEMFNCQDVCSFSKTDLFLEEEIKNKKDEKKLKTPEKKIEVVKSSFCKGEKKGDEFYIDDSDFVKRFSISERNRDTFSQDDLMSEKVYMLDSGENLIFLWVGSISSRKLKKFASKTTKNYIEFLKKEKKIEDIQSFVVEDCLEPGLFKSFFVPWTKESKSYHDRLIVFKQQKKELKENINLSECISVEEYYRKFLRKIISLETLIKRPLLEGLNPLQLEIYLSLEDFQKIFNMKKEEFKKLPKWKQIDIKKKVGLY